MTVFFHDHAHVYLPNKVVTVDMHPYSSLRDKVGRTAVHFASACGHYSLVEVLLNYGGSATTPDKHGYTPVHWASYCGHDKCLESLLEARVYTVYSGHEYTCVTLRGWINSEATHSITLYPMWC